MNDTQSIITLAIGDNLLKTYYMVSVSVSLKCNHEI